MLKKVIGLILAVGILFGFSSTVFAGDVRIAIGADNSESQLATVYKMFGVARDKNLEVVVTNSDEREYLQGLVPDSKIGKNALSCVYIEQTDGDGIDITINNINWCTATMYKNALATAGITDARVIVAAYKPVSGTGALTGIYKAYEELTGKKLDKGAKDVAIEELILTGNLKDLLGDDAEKIIADLKAQLGKTKNMTDDEVRALIAEVAAKYNVTIDAAATEQILQLIRKFNELGLDPDKVISMLDGAKNAGDFFSSIGDFFANVGKSISDFFANIFGAKT